jgi:hypothetical protein
MVVFGISAINSAGGVTFYPRTEGAHSTSKSKNIKLSRYAMQAPRGERMYSSYSFLTLALHGGEWPLSRPGSNLLPEKDPQYPLHRKLDGPQLVWTQRLEEKFFASASD